MMRWSDFVTHRAIKRMGRGLGLEPPQTKNRRVVGKRAAGSEQILHELAHAKLLGIRITHLNYEPVIENLSERIADAFAVAEAGRDRTWADENEIQTMAVERDVMLSLGVPQEQCDDWITQLVNLSRRNPEALARIVAHASTPAVRRAAEALRRRLRYHVRRLSA